MGNWGSPTTFILMYLEIKKLPPAVIFICGIKSDASFLVSSQLGNIAS